MAVPDPIERFDRLFAKARAAGEPQHATAMTLATSGTDGKPSARMVLLKCVDQRGFVFYTNYESRKAAQLEENAYAALVLYWPTIDVQVRVEGPVTRVTESEADEYFASRARQSQLGAWASLQSQPLRSRRELVGRYLQEKAKRFGRAIPRPPHWGGYIVSPERIEFWESRLGRLHDRFLYTRDDDGAWHRQMLFP
jgi:pyridoxamine 5'-phosphate oxidase